MFGCHFPPMIYEVTINRYIQWRYNLMTNANICFNRTILVYKFVSNLQLLDWMSGTEGGQGDAFKDVWLNETWVNCTFHEAPRDGDIELFWSSTKCLLRIFFCPYRDKNPLKEIWTPQSRGSECLQAEAGADSCRICHFKQVRHWSYLLVLIFRIQIMKAS